MIYSLAIKQKCKEANSLSAFPLHQLPKSYIFCVTRVDTVDIHNRCIKPVSMIATNFSRKLNLYSCASPLEYFLYTNETYARLEFLPLKYDARPQSKVLQK